MTTTNALIFAAINLISNIALYKLGQKDVIIKFHEYVQKCREEQE